MARMVLVCLVVAGLSLLGPSQPSYDPWAWLVWGREIAHLGLNTTGGPSWKPLPVVFTTLFAPLSKLDGGIPPALWIVVARAGGLLAMALAFKVAARIAGGSAARRGIAGVVALVAVVLTPDWVRYLLHGNEVPLAIALALWAVDCHLDGRRRPALVLGGLVCLARPELFGCVLLYGVWLWWRAPATRTLVARVAVLVPAAWLVPSWWGSGNPLLASSQARSEPSWSLSLAPVPWRAALAAAQSQAWLVLELGALAAVMLTLVTWRRQASVLPAPAHPGTVVTLAGFAAGIVGLFAAMTQAGFSGNVRYVLPALVAVAIVGGVGAGLLVELGGRVAERILSRAGTAQRRHATMAGMVAAAAVLLLVATPELRNHLDAAHLQAREAVERSRLHTDLARAVDRVGARTITMLGPAAVNRAYQTHLAWELSLPLSDVHGARGSGMAFSASEQSIAGVVGIARRARDRTIVTRVGTWTVTRPRSRRRTAQSSFSALSITSDSVVSSACAIRASTSSVGFRSPSSILE